MVPNYQDRGKSRAWTVTLCFLVSVACLPKPSGDGAGRFDEKAAWLDDLRPAFGKDRFFFEDELAALERMSEFDQVSSGQIHPLAGAEAADEVTNGVRSGFPTSPRKQPLNDGKMDPPEQARYCAGYSDVRYTNDIIVPLSRLDLQSHWISGPCFLQATVASASISLPR